MSQTLTATVYRVMETQTFESGFQKRVLVLETTGDYTQTIPFEFIKEKTTLLDNLEEGQIVTVHYNLRGSEYNGRFFCNLQGWKIDTEQDGSAVIANAARNSATPQPIEEDGDLPF